MQGHDPVSNYFFDENLGFFVPVSQSAPLPSGLYVLDADGNPIGAGDDYPLPVILSDQATRIFSTYLAQDLDAGTYELNANALQGATTLQIVAPTNMLATDTLFIYDGAGAEQVDVLSVTPQVGYDDVVITSPLPKDYLVGTEIYRTTTQMAVSGGSLTSHLDFRMPHPVSAATPIILDITMLSINILDGDTMDDVKFGGIAALTNGIVLHHHRADGINSIFNAKTNGDFKLVGDATYDDRSGGGGDYGFGVRIFFRNEYGAVIRIEPGEYLELLIQDDLSGLGDMRATVAGQVTTQSAAP